MADKSVYCNYQDQAHRIKTTLLDNVWHMQMLKPSWVSKNRSYICSHLISACSESILDNNYRISTTRLTLLLEILLLALFSLLISPLGHEEAMKISLKLGDCNDPTGSNDLSV